MSTMSDANEMLSYYLLEKKKKAKIDVKHPGILEVPEGKSVMDLPLKHFVNLVKKHGYAKVSRALMNLYIWNKKRNPKLAKWAKNMHDRLKEEIKGSVTSLYESYLFEEDNQQQNNQNSENQKKDKNLFSTMYEDVLKSFNFEEYKNSLQSKFSNAQKSDNFADMIYLQIHLRIFRILNEIATSGNYGQNETFKEVSTRIFNEMKKRFQNGVESRLKDDDREILKTISENIKGKKYDLKTMCKIVIHEYSVKYKDLSDNDRKKKIEDSMDNVIPEYIIIFSLSEEQGTEIVQKEIENVFSNSILKTAAKYASKIKEYVVEKFKQLKGPVWEKVKGVFNDIKQKITNFVNEDKKNWIIVGIVAAAVLFVLAKALPFVGRLVKKIIGLIKYGFSKFFGMFSKIGGGGKSEESPALIEVYIRNKHARKIIESKLDRIERLLDIYYSF